MLQSAIAEWKAYKDFSENLAYNEYLRCADLAGMATWVYDTFFPQFSADVRKDCTDRLLGIRRRGVLFPVLHVHDLGRAVVPFDVNGDPQQQAEHVNFTHLVPWLAMTAHRSEGYDPDDPLFAG
jgi:hypothetical protein